MSSSMEGKYLKSYAYETNTFPSKIIASYSLALYKVENFLDGLINQDLNRYSAIADLTFTAILKFISVFVTMRHYLTRLKRLQKKQLGFI